MSDIDNDNDIVNVMSDIDNVWKNKRISPSVYFVSGPRYDYDEDEAKKRK